MDIKDLIKKYKPYIIYPLALIAGGLITFALSPYDHGILGILSPVVLLWCLAKQTPKTAFLVGFCYGIGLYCGAYWIYVSIHDFGDAAPWLAGLITALLILFLSLYSALMCYLVNRFFAANNVTKSLLAFPALWTLFEIFRGWFLTGFPWLYIGYTQMSNHLGAALAPIGSVFAVSWISLFVSGILYLIFDYYYAAKENHKYRNILIGGLIATFLIAFGLNKIVWTEKVDQPVNVALVQGNIAQLMRWDPAYIRLIIDVYRKLTLPISTADVVVWPENAIPVPWPLSQPLINELSEMAKLTNYGLITGIPIELDNKRQYYNAMISVGITAGNLNCETKLTPGCVYLKSHLVPFGEYVPFEKFLRGLISFFDLPMSNFIEGSTEQPPVYAKGYSFSPQICYEIAYPEYVRRTSQDTNFILTISNDTWFGKSIGPLQHLQIARFRALETGKYLIRATNTGYTAIIDPDGKIVSAAKPFEEAVLEGKIYPMHGKTLWTRIGILPIIGLLIVTLIIAFFSEKMR